MNYRLIAIVSVFLLLQSCKEEITEPNNGIYRGVFFEFNSSGDTLASGVFHMALYEENNRFLVSGDTSTLAPPSHGGEYEILDATTMNFKYSGSFDTLHDHDHYLDTVFNYTFDNVNFDLERTDTNRVYQYLMKRD